MRPIFPYTTLFVLLGSLCFVLMGCGAAPRVKTPVFKGQEGTIFLRVFAEPKQRAQHPVALEPHLIRRLLNGLYVQDTQSLLESALTNADPPVQAFTQKEIHFLIPHLIAGLAKATPEEEIVFQVDSIRSHQKEYTHGSLYYSGSTVHINISGYHESSKRASLLSRPSNSFTRPKMWKMSFHPSKAVSSDSLDAASQTSFPFHFAIHLPVLAQSMENEAQTVSPASSSIHEELEGLRESLEHQHQQIERLENQLQTDRPPQSQP